MAAVPSSRRRRTLALIGLLAATACHRTEALPRPLDEVAAALLLVVEGDAVRAVYAVDPEADALAIREAGELYGLFFTCPLDRLGLEAGPVRLVELPGNRVQLPAPAFEGGLEDGAWRARTRPAVVQDALLRLPLAEGAACVLRATQLEGVPATLPADGHNVAAFVIGYGDGTGLAASRNGFFYRLHASGEVDPIDRPIPTDPLAAFAANDGRLWLLDDQGTLWAGPRDGPLTRQVEAPTRFQVGDLVTLAGPGRADGADAPFELFAGQRRDLAPNAAVQSRRLLRFADGAWTTVHTATLTGASGFFVPRVEWMGPDRATALGMGPQEAVLFYEAGGTGLQPLPEGVEELAGLGRGADGAIAVGTNRGAGYRWDGAGWASLGTLGFEAFLTQLQPFAQDGLLLGGFDSLIGFRYGFAVPAPSDAGRTRCPVQRVAGVVAAMAPLDERTFAMVSITSLTTRQSFSLELLRVRAPEARCSGD